MHWNKQAEALNKTNEDQHLSILKNHFSNMTDLEKSHDKCKYDAFNEEFILEFKNRRATYPDTMIEYQKFENNMKDHRRFLYSIIDEPMYKLYIWDVSQLNDENYNFKWHRKKAPRTTDFNYNHKIYKKVGYLDKKDAKYVINLITNEKEQLNY